MKARTSTCRIAPRAKSSTPEPTTTTPWRAGGIRARRSTSAATRRPTSDAARMASIGRSSARRYVPPASLSIVPLQDVLGLGSEARMNTPSLHGGNWRWRFDPATAHERIGRETGAARRVERSSFPSRSPRCRMRTLPRERVAPASCRLSRERLALAASRSIVNRLLK